MQSGGVKKSDQVFLGWCMKFSIPFESKNSSDFSIPHKTFLPNIILLLTKIRQIHAFFCLWDWKYLCWVKVTNIKNWSKQIRSKFSWVQYFIDIYSPIRHRNNIFFLKDTVILFYSFFVSLFHEKSFIKLK